MPRPNTADDVWRYIERHPTDCWEWIAASNTPGVGGYGQIKIRMKSYRAHRVAYESANGPIPKGMIVCHSCDNRRCCRPSHLFLGTHQDNSNDMRLKGRSYRGTLNRAAKLNENKILEIREKNANGIGYHTLSKEYGVTVPAIQAIVKRKTWAHI